MPFAATKQVTITVNTAMTMLDRSGLRPADVETLNGVCPENLNPFKAGLQAHRASKVLFQRSGRGTEPAQALRDELHLNVGPQ